MKKVILLKNLAKSAAGRKEEARTRYIYIYTCQFCQVPLHKSECFTKCHTNLTRNIGHK